jgi:hypothetical protein
MVSMYSAGAAIAPSVMTAARAAQPTPTSTRGMRQKIVSSEN